MFYREFSYYRIRVYTYFSLYILDLIIFPFCCHWFGLIFHVSVSPSTLSFSWVLLLPISLTFRCPEKQKTEAPRLLRFSPCPKPVHYMQRQTEPSGDMQACLVPCGRKSLISHFASPTPHSKCSPREQSLCGNGIPGDNRSNSFCRVLIAPTF